jgi:murein DD-endopeptidase MepM/ murein hydrolase activator NlpD
MIQKLRACILLTVFAMFFLSFLSVKAQSSEDLKSKIEEKNSQIKEIEEEIRQYSLEVDNANKESKTLQSTIKALDLTKSKLNKDINLTQNKITKTNLTIEEVNDEILDTEEILEINKKAVTNAIRRLNITENRNLVSLVLSNNNLGELWSEMDYNTQVQENIRKKSKELVELKTKMVMKQNTLNIEKGTLQNLKKDLNGKKLAIEYTVSEKNQILKYTKNKEKVFKDLVKSKEELKAQFEKEIFEYESQINILIDKGSYPAPRHGVLSWPLDDVLVTQKFGKTIGAEKLYASGSHNGADLRASIGTKVKGALHGRVSGTGNTDIYPGCYSFGKWVMVEHENGLSTIYAHLSVISVKRGDMIKTGDVLGFSGNTGYSTGPHLHFGLYATQGVRIEQFIKSKGCKHAIIPLADIKAYLDPLEYLPNL